MRSIRTTNTRRKHQRTRRCFRGDLSAIAPMLVHDCYPDRMRSYWQAIRDGRFIRHTPKGQPWVPSYMRGRK